MQVHGRVQNGVVVLQGGVGLPEGTAVTVWCPGPSVASPPHEKKRIQVPLVRSAKPGSVHLTGERIAAVLDEEDASPRR